MNVDFHRSASVDPKAPLVAAESPFKKKFLAPESARPVVPAGLLADAGIVTNGGIC
jgi:hypothetical protein